VSLSILWCKQFQSIVCVDSQKRAHRAIVRATKSFISGITAIAGSVTADLLLRNFPSSVDTKCQQDFSTIFCMCTLFVSDAMCARQSLVVRLYNIGRQYCHNILCQNVQITSVYTEIECERTKFYLPITVYSSSFNIRFSVSYSNSP